MAEVESSSAAVKTLRGLHLYHAGRSACSARVRLALEEKRLPWASHHVDIYKRANVTPEYFAINPKGLVPALVHDGRVLIESNDIMLYIEDAFPDPSFSPESPEETRAMERWMQRCGDLHLPGVKTFAYARTHAANVVKTPEEIALYRSLQTDPELLAFHAKHDGEGASFAEEDVQGAAALLNEALGEIDSIVGAEGWLVGGAYSLADMSWCTAITTLQGAGFPLAGFPHLVAWYERIAQRPAFRIAVAEWRKDGVTAPPPGSYGRDWQTGGLEQ